MGGHETLRPLNPTNKVLLIDDDEAFRSRLEDLLCSRGWKVLRATDGESGLRLALDHQPDIVFCDLLNPRCNGLQFCRALHARRTSLPNTKVVVSSGSGYAIDRINALESGADEFVAKPIQAEEVLQLFQQLARGSAGCSDPEPGSIPGHGVTRLRFWGVRGSIPSPGPETVYYGGNTSCVEVRADGELIILDAGTGLRGLGQELKREFRDRPMRLTMLVSHTHWDHIQGFPFFAPAYDPRNRLRILAFDGPRKGLEATLAIQMESPYFPVPIHSMPSHIEFVELKTMDFEIGAVRVKAAFMNHPGVCVGYRLYTSAGSIAYFPDNELFGRLRTTGTTFDTEFAMKQDDKLRAFIQDADVVISDAQYDAQEYPEHAGWGHSCAEDVVQLAMASGVKQLFLFHHDPEHGDAHIARMLASAREQVLRRGSHLQVEAAREGLEIQLRAPVTSP